MPSLQSRIVNTCLRLMVKHRRVKDLAQLRQQVERIDARTAKIPPDAIVLEQVLNGVPCQWVRVPGSPKKCLILYYHGGAYCVRTAKTHCAFLSRLCRGVNGVGLMPFYRLAPEDPYPAALQDCLKTYQWAISNGFDPERIVIAGDSAGGGLALSTLVQIRDAQLPRPRCAVFFSAATDATFTGASFVTNRKKDPMFKMESLMQFRHAYLQAASPADPKVSPLYAAFHDLPPLYFQVSGSELLRDSSVLAYQKALAAGVHAKLHIRDGMPHCYQIMDIIPESRAAIKKAIEFIRLWI